MAQFTSVQWISLQSPLIMVASMLTGKDVAAILAMNVHDRCVLLDDIVVQIHELIAACADATEPTGPGGVTLTEAEVSTIVDEADDIPAAIKALGV